MKMSSHSEMLLSAAGLASLTPGFDTVIVDCRFDFSGPDKGRQDYLASHIPGAHYAHLDHDLASPVNDQSGRHPLPEAAGFAEFLAGIGWTPEKLLVAYDGKTSAIAARLWWLMRYFGHKAALLDGGFEAWINAGLATESGETLVDSAQPVVLHADPSMVVACADVLANLEKPDFTLVDARAPERFDGKVEPLDSQAGHIPGAMNRFLGENLDSSGQFKSSEQLKAEFEELLQKAPGPDVVHSCGSGITACHNQFAMELAGLSSSRIFPGSWSEWIRDTSRPIEKGGE